MTQEVTTTVDLETPLNDIKVTTTVDLERPLLMT